MRQVVIFAALSSAGPACPSIEHIRNLPQSMAGTKNEKLLKKSDRHMVRKSDAIETELLDRLYELGDNARGAIYNALAPLGVLLEDKPDNKQVQQAVKCIKNAMVNTDELMFSLGAVMTGKDPEEVRELFKKVRKAQEQEQR
jgi:hypothetical protein